MIIKPQFTPEEAQDFVDLMDVAIRAQGIQGSQKAMPLVAKMHAAAQAAQASEPAGGKEEVPREDKEKIIKIKNDERKTEAREEPDQAKG